MAPEEDSIFSEEEWLSRLQTVEPLNNGTSTNNLTPLDPSQTTNHGISNHQENPETCKSGAPAHNGGKSSSTLETTSKTFTTRRFLMFQEEKILKDKLLSSGADTTKPTRDGQLSMLIKPLELELEDITENSDSKSTEYST
jgi:hypothetical protein